MTSRVKFALFVSLLLVSAISFAEPRPTHPPQLHAPLTDSTWERVKEEDGVIIFLRERPGDSIKEAIGKGVIDAPPCRVFQVLTDLDRLAQFMPYLKSRIRKNGSADGDYSCQYLDFPWPISDRFVNLRTNRIQNYRNNPCEFFVYWRKDETYSCTIDE
ncbi:MAG: SRPBCC family protein, partial [Candidatus Methylomirabilales bacterium]